MPTVTIGADSYEVYEDVAYIDSYLNAAASEEAATWRATIDQDAKARAAVSVTRYLNSLPWKGDKTNDYQPLAWPRSGIDGVDDALTPQAVLDAYCELCALANAGEDFGGTTGFAAAEQKRLKAGSVEIENFASIRSSFSSGRRYPQVVLNLLRQYLLGSGTLVGAVATGVCHTNRTLKRGFGLTQGF